MTIALLHPGEMGAAVGACLVERGERVVWASAGRGVATAERAKAAGLEDRGTVAAAVDGAEIVLSVSPPHAALDVARAVAAAGFRGLYVDANAISPATTREVGAIVSATGARFVDGGIIGPPPAAGRASKLYLAGEGAGTFGAKFFGTPLEAIVLEGDIGAASAIKACYAAWTKGSVALLTAIRALARAENVEPALIDEWRRSQPDLAKRCEAAIPAARKAWRWIAEMDEIAASFAAVGLPDGFHAASADVYERLACFKDAKVAPTVDDIVDMLLATPGRQG